MYYNNKIYGNAAALNRYVNRSIDYPIWGEIQHSLNFDLNALTNSNSPKLIKRYFTWRAEDARMSNLKFGKKWKFLPIGDPFLYELSNLGVEFSKKKMDDNKKILIAPQYNRKNNSSLAAEKHYRLVERFNKFHDYIVEVSLHPGEFNNSEIRRIYKDGGITIATRPSFIDQEYLIKEYEFLSEYKTIHTDYIGPSLIRAIYLGVEGKSLRLREKGDRSTEKLKLPSDLIEQSAFAKKLLGYDDKKTKKELIKLLNSGYGRFNEQILREIKHFKNSDLISKYRSKFVINLKVFCPRCINLSMCKVLQGMIICGRCGFKLTDKDDFLCVRCLNKDKIKNIDDHQLMHPPTQALNNFTN